MADGRANQRVCGPLQGLARTALHGLEASRDLGETRFETLPVFRFQGGGPGSAQGLARFDEGRCDRCRHDGQERHRREHDHGSDRASDVIARLRALFTKREVTTEWVDLNQVVRDVIALSSGELRRGRVIVRAELADDLPAAAGDRVQLQQVTMNLLLNAADAMSAVSDRARDVLISTRFDDEDSVHVSVTDAGVGLEPQGADRIFDPFYTTKPLGMGIGLSVSGPLSRAIAVVSRPYRMTALERRLSSPFPAHLRMRPAHLTVAQRRRGLIRLAS